MVAGMSGTGGPGDAGDISAALSGLAGAGGMAGLLAQAQKMQQDLADAQERLGETMVEGSAGGGLVTATLTGTGTLVALRISPEAVDPHDVETLEDLVLAAVHDAAARAADLQESTMSPLAQGLGGAGGLGLPGF